ncbi:hypothetical protein PTSG_07083 [Salpingoeca rosetta]|uniref:Rab-GAP TBC domain-containing protein n=1 Tax=Salpingoeca rosetta (strain ATCC 50818 / BSB-021) TaxID=946362 RepID=F2UE03_SALR5|nr:uncharacterized protein PTSG_07083 [Salpingoeca rosetta]EGD74853.1 hypothetical protein PTSG_07083 [Salpingoeca rosetta]|eukprot:XP_004992498.1 hypothetical protein PTSG_07083 [Salpingoeca rosetta]
MSLATTATTQRSEPLTREQWESYFADDGRVLNQSEIRKRVFAGGIDPEVRKEVWFFLLGVYPFLSTTREREVLMRTRRMEYRAMKERWQEEFEPEKHDAGDSFSAADDLDPEDQFAFIQAKITAMGHQFDRQKADSSIRTIKKDVPRTDRETEYFREDDNIHLQWLNDILITYAVFHEEVGYVQGMNDVLSIILPIIDDEVEAYWCFAQYLETIQADFMATGMVQNLRTLEELVAIMDPDLRRHLIDVDAGEMIYCHSIEAERERSKERRTQRQKQLGGTELAPQEKAEEAAGDTFETKYKFELFVCIAILEEYRDHLMACETMADVFQFINGLSEKMHLDTILLRSEEAFFRYCRESVHSTRGADDYLLKS